MITLVDSLPHGVKILAGRAWAWKVWEGEPMTGSVLSLDTETEVIEDPHIPRLALASACDGANAWLIRPDGLSLFLERNQNATFIFQNVAFDYHVIQAHAPDSNVLPAALDSGRVKDTMLFDMLIRLGASDAYPDARDLGWLSAHYAAVSDIDKNDPFRMRYSELLGVDWSDPTIDPGFWSYAIADPIATWLVYRAQLERAEHIAARRGVPAAVSGRFGPLSLDIQVKASVAFAALRRRGIAVDVTRAETARDALKARMRECYESVMDSGVNAEGLFKPTKADGPSLLSDAGKKGEPALTPTGGPSLSLKTLQAVLLDVAADIEKDTGTPVEIPRTDRGAVSTSAKEWGDFSHLHPFISAWAELVETSKLIQFFKHFERPSVHPRYTVMVRTGRTSASGPNVQQIPRGSDLRGVFVPSPGHYLLATDYAFIELRTLASVCEQRFGYSVLADVIRKGIDPHVYTAALVNGMEPGEFIGLKKSDPDKFKADRQAAKAINFGIPGGLGPRTLAVYARRTYGVADMTQERARELREKLITEVYPEIGEYLSDDPAANLARSLGCDLEALWRRFEINGERSPGIMHAVRKIVHGIPYKADGTPYHPRFIVNTWESLFRLNKRPDLRDALSMCDAGPELSARLFYEPAVTLTGRVRGRVSYSQARNTPFQGLAADGGKLAVYRLFREGFRVVAFIHDEILVELPDRGGYVDLSDVHAVERIMIEEMESVVPGVPIGVESTVSDRWSKSARLIVEGGRVIPWSPEA